MNRVEEKVDCNVNNSSMQNSHKIELNWKIQMFDSLHHMVIYRYCKVVRGTSATCVPGA